MRDLFDGTASTFARWRRIGGDTDLALADGRIVTTGDGDFSLLYYPAETFEDFVLRVTFMLSSLDDNSGIFIRCRDPRLPPTPEILARDAFGHIATNNAWIAVHSGFEVQIDERARGDARLGEPDGLRKNRTGAIYKIPAGDGDDATLQDYTGRPGLEPGRWYRYEIEVAKNVYTVRLGPDGGALTQTTRFTNADDTRAISPRRTATSASRRIRVHASASATCRSRPDAGAGHSYGASSTGRSESRASARRSPSARASASRSGR